MTSYTLHTERLVAMLQRWCSQEAATPDAAAPSTLFIVVGKAFDEMQANQRSVGVMQCVFDTDDISDVALAMCPDRRKIVIASTRSATEFSVLDSVALSDGSTTYAVKLICGEHSATAAEMLEELRGSQAIAVAAKELPVQKGAFAEELVSRLRNEGAFNTADKSSQIGALLSVKDDKAIEYVQKAAALASATLKKYILPEMERQLESDRRLPMNTFSERIWDMLQHPNKLPGLEQLPSQHYDGAFQPVVVQSGGIYDLRIIQDSMRSEQLVGDCVVFAYGTVHMGFTAYIGRTVIIESQVTKELPEQYKFLLSISSKVIEHLRPGTPLNEVYSKASAFATESNPSLASKLTREFGFMTGLLVLEARGVINEKAVTIVEAGMTFVVRVGLDGVEGKMANGENRTFSLLIADTVVVRENSTDLLTRGKRELNDILYKEETVVEEEEVDESARDLKAITRAGKGAIPQISNEDARRARQLEILAEKAASWTAAGGQVDVVETEDLRLTELGRLAKGDTVSHRPGDSDVPKLSATQLEVIRGKETMWLPINKIPTPFHISTVSKIDIKSLSSVKHLMTISLHALQESNVAYKANRTKVFMKQITLLGDSKERFESFANQVQQVQQIIKNKDALRKQQQGVVKQGGLQLNKKGTAPRLKRVKCRPPPLQAKFGVSGDLEAHDNGFRFMYIGGDPLVLLYENVKHMIFQPSQNDIFTVFHVTLKQPIMVGKKKCEEVQFVAEVAETSEAVAITKRSHEEELAADYRDKQRVRQTNAEFVLFSQKVEGVADMKVHMPLNEFEFTGCASRAMTKFQGNSECLWSVGEMPFFTLRLTDVEVASLERILPGGANFDLTFIHKDYRKTTTITTIPQSKVDIIKDWLNIGRCIYFESSANISWAPVLKEIRETKGWEPWGPGGWRTYLESDDEEEDEDEEDSDTTYETSTSDDDDDDDSDWAEEISESDFSTPSSSAESGESWDEMERKAEEHDRRRAREEDSDGEAPKRKTTRREPGTGPVTQRPQPQQQRPPGKQQQQQRPHQIPPPSRLNPSAGAHLQRRPR